MLNCEIQAFMRKLLFVICFSFVGISISFPQTDGEILLTGLDAPVEIYRDLMGIPQIYAATTHDLFFAQGYVHAQVQL